MGALDSIEQARGGEGVRGIVVGDIFQDGETLTAFPQDKDRPSAFLPSLKEVAI